MPVLTDAWRAKYESQFASMVIPPKVVAEASAVALKINVHRDIYEAISKRTNGVPWFLIGALHDREASLDFTKFLGDGEPLCRATVNVPAHMGPFTGPNAFEDGAVAALEHEGFQHVTDWCLGSILFHAEAYNGEGYHDYHPTVPNPYVWAGSSIYVRGKYDCDGHFDADLVDKQLGVAVILWTMKRLGFITLSETQATVNSHLTVAAGASGGPAPGSVSPKPFAGSKGKAMNTLIFKMASQWALARLGELSTWTGFWVAAHADYNVFLNPHLETALTNVGLAAVAACLVVMKEGWHAPVAA